MALESGGGTFLPFWKAANRNARGPGIWHPAPGRGGEGSGGKSSGRLFKNGCTVGRAAGKLKHLPRGKLLAGSAKARYFRPVVGGPPAATQKLNPKQENGFAQGPRPRAFVDASDKKGAWITNLTWPAAFGVEKKKRSGIPSVGLRFWNSGPGNRARPCRNVFDRTAQGGDRKSLRARLLP